MFYIPKLNISAFGEMKDKSDNIISGGQLLPKIFLV